MSPSQVYKKWRDGAQPVGKLPTSSQPLFPMLLTRLLLATIAVIDPVLPPRLHGGVFLYPVAIISALWWGRDRAVLVVTGFAIGLMALEQVAHPTASYRVDDPSPLVAGSNFLLNLLLIGLFGSACVY